MVDTVTVRAEVEAQGALQPGTEGWWQVWGAVPGDLEPGDYVLMKDDEFLVQDVFVAKSPARIGIVVDGERLTLGLLCRVVILRRGTHGTLSRSVR
jgi:hypothetical protein